MNTTKLLILVCLLLTIPINNYGQDSDSLLISMDELMAAPKDRIATVEMTVTDKNDDSKVREAILKQKGADRKLYRYTKPEKKAGIATLALPDGVMWLYMPSFGKAIKISLLSKSQAFTGTDFSYEDMSGVPYNTRYEPKILQTENEDEYMLELTPRSNKTRYSRIVLSLNKNHNYPIKMAFFDKDNNYEKLATYKYEKKDSYWYAKEVLMTDLRKKHSTKIVMKDIKFDQGLTNDEFTIETLKQ